MSFQRKRSIPWNSTETNRGVEFIIFSREKHISWTIFGLNHRLNNKKVEKSSSCLKRVKNSLERELNYQIIHSRGKVIPLNFEQMEQSALSLKKSITSFGAVKNPKFIILIIFVPISRVVVTLNLIYSLLIVNTLLRRTYSFSVMSVQIFINVTLRHMQF